MKLTNETLTVLKNFASINQGIQFKKGKKIKTMSQGKSVMAEANVKDEFPEDFCVYDLNEFLLVYNLFKDSPDLSFDSININFKSGKRSTKYRMTDKGQIVIPPEKQLTMPEPEIKFTLSAEDYDWVMRAASVLSSPQVAIESDGSKINIVTLDLANDSAHTDALEIGNGNGNKYRMIFKTENISKILSGGYDVFISSKGISNFKHKTQPLQYWITTEQGSKFEKAD